MRAVYSYGKWAYLRMALLSGQPHTTSSAKGLTGPKLVLTCVKKALGVDLCTPPAATSLNSQWAYRYLAAAARGFMGKNY
jgi:hypothetical protein